VIHSPPDFSATRSLPESRPAMAWSTAWRSGFGALAGVSQERLSHAGSRIGLVRSQRGGEFHDAPGRLDAFLQRRDQGQADMVRHPD